MTYRHYKTLLTAAKNYARRERLKLLRYTYGFIDKKRKVPVVIFERGCQIQLAPNGIKIVDVWKR